MINELKTVRDALDSINYQSAFFKQDGVKPELWQHTLKQVDIISEQALTTLDALIERCQTVQPHALDGVLETIRKEIKNEFSKSVIKIMGCENSSDLHCLIETLAEKVVSNENLRATLKQYMAEQSGNDTDVVSKRKRVEGHDVNYWHTRYLILKTKFDKLSAQPTDTERAKALEDLDEWDNGDLDPDSYLILHEKTIRAALQAAQVPADTRAVDDVTNLVLCLFRAWAKDKERAVSLGRLDDAYELGFTAAWNARAQPLPADRAAALDELNNLIFSDGAGAVCKWVNEHQQTIRAALSVTKKEGV